MKSLILMILIGVFMSTTILLSQVDSNWIQEYGLKDSTGFFCGVNNSNTINFCIGLENGILEGTSSYYVKDSKIYVEENYSEGKKSGTGYYYRENLLTSTKYFVNDTLMLEVVFSNNGDKTIIDYNDGVKSRIRFYNRRGILYFEKIYIQENCLYSIWYFSSGCIKKIVIWERVEVNGIFDFKYKSEIRFNKKSNIVKTFNISEELAQQEFNFIMNLSFRPNPIE